MKNPYTITYGTGPELIDINHFPDLELASREIATVINLKQNNQITNNNLNPNDQKINALSMFNNNENKKSTTSQDFVKNIEKKFQEEKQYLVQKNQQLLNEKNKLEEKQCLVQEIQQLLYEKKNSERQFYTVPNTTIPNDQKGFAEWLFKTENTCKYDGINCLEYEDEKYH